MYIDKGHTEKLLPSPFPSGLKDFHVQLSLESTPQHLLHKEQGLQLDFHAYQFEIFHKVQPIGAQINL